MSHQPARFRALFCTLTAVTILAGAAPAATLYSNGFETDISGWDVFGPPLNATRVTSGTGGISSATGAFHATSATGTGAAGNFGGYNFGATVGSIVPFQEYYTSLDVYLDVNATQTNDVRFDYSSAINNLLGNFLRDFVFNVGFYTSSDTDGPGAGTNRFVVSASNNAGRADSNPRNPARDPFAISNSGWYTLEHHFYDSAGTLNVDLNIFDAANTLLHSWTLATDPIASVGGNRYGWFVNNEFQALAFDNTEMRTPDTSPVPETGTMTLLVCGLAAIAAGRLIRLRR